MRHWAGMLLAPRLNLAWAAWARAVFQVALTERSVLVHMLSFAQPTKRHKASGLAEGKSFSFSPLFRHRIWPLPTPAASADGSHLSSWAEARKKRGARQRSPGELGHTRQSLSVRPGAVTEGLASRSPFSASTSAGRRSPATRRPATTSRYPPISPFSRPATRRHRLQKAAA